MCHFVAGREAGICQTEHGFDDWAGYGVVRLLTIFCCMLFPACCFPTAAALILNDDCWTPGRSPAAEFVEQHDVATVSEIEGLFDISRTLALPGFGNGWRYGVWGYDPAGTDRFVDINGDALAQAHGAWLKDLGFSPALRLLVPFFLYLSVCRYRFCQVPSWVPGRSGVTVCTAQLHHS